MASTVLTRWRAKLVTRKALVVAARARHRAHPTDASRKLLAHRKAQVVEAQKVIARHKAGPVTTVSDAGVKLVKEFEGYIGHQYRDSVGVLTIGYGTTEADVRPLPKSLTEPQAAALLRKQLDHKYAPAVAALHLPLSQHQFDALTSVVYNLGPGIIGKGHTLGDALRRHQFKAAADAILLYDHAGGQRLEGLTRRRKAERALFLK